MCMAALAHHLPGGSSVQNVILDGCRAGSPDEGGAIEVFDSTEVLDPAHRGVEIRNCRNTKVVECMIVDRRAKPTMHEPVRIGGDAG